MNITPLDINTASRELSALISASFQTVAKDFGITRENAPTNPAFLTEETLRKSAAEKPVVFYGCREHDKLLGCYALENAGGGVFYLERLAVLPSERHKGIGRALVADAVEKARAAGGKKISIGIIDGHKVLKSWYTRLGFMETGTKSFPRLPFTVCFMELGL